MRLLRALWHPLTPLAVVLVVLPLLTLLAPPEMRATWMILVFCPGSFLAAWLSTRALRSALDRIPVPADAPEPSFREATLERTLRWLLVLVAVLGTFSIFVGVLGVRSWRPAPPPGPATQDFELEPYQSVLLAVLPLLFALLGAQLWVHLASARRRRAQGLAPLPFQPASTTGDERLDARLQPRARASLVLGLVATAGSALANLLPPTMQIVQTLSKGDGKDAASSALLQPWRFFTASFIHPDVTTLVVAILAFAAVAPIVEALLGRGWLVLTVIGGGFFATVASYVFVPRDTMGLFGADAALAGLLVFFALLQRHRLPPATVEHIAVRAGVVLVIVALSCALLRTADVAAAFGGFGFGMLLSPLARPSAAVREALERTRAEAEAEAAPG